MILKYWYSRILQYKFDFYINKDYTLHGKEWKNLYEVSFHLLLQSQTCSDPWSLKTPISQGRFSPLSERIMQKCHQFYVLQIKKDVHKHFFNEYIYKVLWFRCTLYAASGHWESVLPKPAYWPWGIPPPSSAELGFPSDEAYRNISHCKLFNCKKFMVFLTTRLIGHITDYQF